jgi:chemotaxis protein methyltransferase CheR
MNPVLGPGVKLSFKDFTRLSQFIHHNFGIKLPASKHTMLQSRLAKRLRALGMRDYSQYCDYVLCPEGMEEELVHMVDVVTTNKTEFFREKNTFDRFKNLALPSLLQDSKLGASNPLRVWSAGCSTGEEVYTLAICLAESSLGRVPHSYSILGSDISSQVLATARMAMYKNEAVRPIPQELRRKYLMRGKDSAQGLVRVVPELRARVRFQRLNLMEPFSFTRPKHVVFCRNVLIYFDHPTQENLLRRFCQVIRPGGFLILGHSETLQGMQLPLKQIAPLMYEKVT